MGDHSIGEVELSVEFECSRLDRQGSRGRARLGRLVNNTHLYTEPGLVNLGNDARDIRRYREPHAVRCPVTCCCGTALANSSIQIPVPVSADRKTVSTETEPTMLVRAWIASARSFRAAAIESSTLLTAAACALATSMRVCPSLAALPRRAPTPAPDTPRASASTVDRC
jgi:hypothetical protein